MLNNEDNVEEYRHLQLSVTQKTMSQNPLATVSD